MRQVFFLGFSSADIEDRGECRRACGCVDDDAACEVFYSDTGEVTSTPDHVDEGEIDEEEPGDEEEEIGFEADAVGEGARYEGGCDDGEHHLIDDEDIERDAGIASEGRGGVNTDEEGVVEVADDAALSAAEAEAVADREPDDVDDRHADEALDHDGEDVLASDEAAVEEGEAWSHEHDKTSSH